MQTPLIQQPVSCSVEQPSAAITAIANVRKQFPIHTKNPKIVFFDNASTTQKPAAVIETIKDYYEQFCANAGRASYRWATKASAGIDSSRAIVAQFINADISQVVFTSGATEGLNHVAFSW